MQDALPITLDCGETVTVKCLTLERTFRGWLEGDPLTISQKIRHEMARGVRSEAEGQPRIILAPPGQSFNPGKCVVCGTKTDKIAFEFFTFGKHEDVMIEFYYCGLHANDEHSLRNLHTSLIAMGASEPLPSWKCLGNFISHSNDGSYDLEIFWFTDSVEMPIRDLIWEGIRSVDWTKHARFTRYEDY